MRTRDRSRDKSIRSRSIETRETNLTKLYSEEASPGVKQVRQTLNSGRTNEFILMKETQEDDEYNILGELSEKEEADKIKPP